MKKTYFTLATLTLFTSCSGIESFESKMQRYHSKDIAENTVPELKPVDFTITSRKIASVESVEASSLVDDKTIKDSSNKKLYFQNLFSQYQTLVSFMPEKSHPNIDSCPQFHGNFLTEKKPTILSGTNYVFSYDFEKLTEAEYVAKHPELFLPVTKNEKTPRVVDLLISQKINNPSLQSDTVKSALSIHLSKTHSELKELCEFGVSQNYYIFENLLTHAKVKGIESNTNGVKILLKTTLFSNLALETSLNTFKKKESSRMPASATSENRENEIMKRLNVVWMKDYYQAMKK